MYIQIAGGILNLLWYGLADLLRGRILMAVVKGLFHYFGITLIAFIFASLELLPFELSLWIVLVPYWILIFMDGSRTFKPDEQATSPTIPVQESLLTSDKGRATEGTER